MPMETGQLGPYMISYKEIVRKEISNQKCKKILKTVTCCYTLLFGVQLYLAYP